MEQRVDIINDLFSPASKWVNREVFGNKENKTVCQSFEDNTGIPKIVLEVGLITLTAVAIKKMADSRNQFI